VNDQADGAPHFVLQSSIVAVSILIESDLLAQSLGVESPAFDEGGVVSVLAEVRQPAQFLTDGYLQMVTGHAFVVGDGFDIQSQTVFGVPLVDVDAARARTVLRSRRIVCRNGISGAKRIHRNYHKLVFRQASEELGKLGLHLASVLRIEIEDLFARRGVETAIFFDVVVKAGEVVE